MPKPLDMFQIQNPCTWARQGARPGAVARCDYRGQVRDGFVENSNPDDANRLPSEASNVQGDFGNPDWDICAANNDPIGQRRCNKFIQRI
jgi:hypothetical protein